VAGRYAAAVSDVAIADLRRLVDATFDEAVDTRRDFHAHPELSFAEKRTTAVVVDRLRGIGASELPCPTNTGAVFAIDGGRPGRTVLVRADIDALPVLEEVDVGFRSTVDGVMHACGHDAHTAILLGVAGVLADRATDLPGRYVLLFQPAEEALGGAVEMIEGGVIETTRPDRVIGLHVASLLHTGLVAARPGIAMSMGQKIAVRLRGRGGHGAMSGVEGNVLLAAAALAGRLGEAAAGMEYEEVSCVCSAGVLRAGTALNVIPRDALVEGSLRTFTDAQHATAAQRLRELCDEIGAEYDVSAHLDLPPPVSAVVNDAAATATWRQAATSILGSDSVLEMPPATPSDDVSEFLRRIPGCYFFVGAATGPAPPAMHHAPDFAIDEECLRTGMQALIAGAIAMARGDG
jgi:amidohydrolase